MVVVTSQRLILMILRTLGAEHEIELMQSERGV